MGINLSQFHIQLLPQEKVLLGLAAAIIERVARNCQTRSRFIKLCSCFLTGQAMAVLPHISHRGHAHGLKWQPNH